MASFAIMLCTLTGSANAELQKWRLKFYEWIILNVTQIAV